MCAIAGLVKMRFDDAIGKKMLTTMRHRGPDGTGIYHTQEVALLHTRLAIIDIQGGSQPMYLQYGNENYVISYNGELYNTDEIASSLRAVGHRFKGHSDTEVVLHAYAQWGEEALARLNGIFAFAVWHCEEKKLFLARDRMGVKPLFYICEGDRLLFASEIKTLLAHPDTEAKLDANGVAQLLLLGPGRIPGSGVLSGVQELLPGHYATFEKGRMRTEAYWKLRDREHRDTFAQTVEKVRYLVGDAIERQMVSDVPIGTFLSGGLDSSLITAVCANKHKERGERLHTFSLDYLNNQKFFVPGKFQPSSDTEYINIMDRSFDTDHHWTVLTTDELLEKLEDATVARDLPGMADVDFSLLAFCQHIRSRVKVALSGECADEIFGGYPWFTDSQVRQTDGFPWAQNTKYRASFLQDAWLNGLDAEDFVYAQYTDSIAKTDILPGTSPQEARMKQMMHLNMYWFMQTLLDRKDRMSMYCGLEVRVPFCDWRIAEYLYTVPWEYKYHNGAEKGLLRTAMDGILPDEILWRKKNPYPKTYDPRYLELVSDRLRALIQDRSAPIHQIVKKEALLTLLTAEYTWPWYGQLMKVPQTISFMLQLDHWLRIYNVKLVL